MEIGFYSNKRKIEKNYCMRYDLNLRPSDHKHDALASAAIGILHINDWNLIYYRNFECTQS